MQPLKLLIYQNGNKYLEANGLHSLKLQPDIIMLERKYEELLKFADLRGNVKILKEELFVNNNTKGGIKTIFYFDDTFRIERIDFGTKKLNTTIFHDYSRDLTQERIFYLENRQFHRSLFYKHDKYGNVIESIEKNRSGSEEYRKYGYKKLKTKHHLIEEFYSFYDRKRIFLNGKLQKVEGKNYYKEWIYNSKNKLEKTKQIIKTSGTTTDIIQEYSELGRLKKKKVIEYDKTTKTSKKSTKINSYDKFKNLIKSMESEDEVTKKIIEYEYENQRLKTINEINEQIGRRTSTSIEYNNHHHLSKIEIGSFVLNIQYKYDAHGNWISKKETSTNGKVNRFQRDIEYSL